MRVVCLFASLLCVASICPGQVAPKEIEVLQQMTAELHQLRLATEANAIAAQRMAIAISAMQLQDGAVVRAAEKLEEVRANCLAIDKERVRSQKTIRTIERRLSGGMVTIQEASDMRAGLEEWKSVIETQNRDSQSCQSNEAGLSSRLRSAQAQLSEMKARVDSIDRALEKLGSVPR